MCSPGRTFQAQRQYIQMSQKRETTLGSRFREKFRTLGKQELRRSGLTGENRELVYGSQKPVTFILQTCDLYPPWILWRCT